jgi:hypothetical protein
MKSFDINKIEPVENERLDLPEALTGEYIQGLPENAGVEPNAELEGDEYVQFPDDLKTTQKVAGPSHKEGGVDMMIPDGTKVVSKKRTLTKEQAKNLQKEFELKVDTKTSYAEAIDLYTKKIGLSKINTQQEELYAELEKQLKNESIDPKTLDVNKRYLSGKIAKLESEKQMLEADKATFFDKVFQMQEEAKPKEDTPKNVYEEGGTSYQHFENTIKRLGLDREKALQYLREGGKAQTQLPEYEGGVEIFVTKETSLPTGADLNDKQKEELLKYYEKHNPAVSKALKSGGLKWESVVLNKGLVDDLEAKGFESIITDHQGTDKNSKLLKNAPTYGSMTEGRVSNFVLKDYFEQVYGKPFSEATPDEIKKLQLDYNDALTKQGIPYQSGVNPNEVSDGNFGNRTSSYLRSVVQVSGNKEGRIDVDRILKLPADQLQAALDEYGLKASDLDPYKNAAYKYIDIVPGKPAEPAKAPEETLDASIPPQKGKLRDFVDINNRKVETPKMFYMPDQSTLPPSALEVGLMVDNTFQRIDPVKIGIDQAIQETNNSRMFATDMLETAPISQRISAMANVLASSNEALNKSIVETNRINAQNQASAELYNAGRADAENIARGNNLLSYEERAMKAKALTEEEIRNYFDRNKTVALNNLANQQRLNILDQLSPNYDINVMGTGIDYAPAYEWRVNQNPNTQRFTTEEEKQLDINERNRIFEEFMKNQNK